MIEGMDGCILPQDVIPEIMSWLPIESIARFSCVCKGFYELFKRIDFIDLHLSRSKERIFVEKRGGFSTSLTSLSLIEEGDYGSLWKAREIPIRLGGLVVFPTISTCNGLICAVRSHVDDQALAVYNPITNESIELPLSDRQGKRLLSIGFGFDSKSKRYKVVRLSEDDDEGVIVRKGEIVTVGDSLWRGLDVPFSVLFGRSFSPLFHGGAFHWIVDKEIHSDSVDGLERILILDISTETFQTCSYKLNISYPLTTLVFNCGEHLCLAEQQSSEVEEIIDVYRLTPINSSAVGHTQHCSYLLPPSKPWDLYLISFLMDDTFLIGEVNLSNNFRDDHLAIFNPKTGLYRNIGVNGIPRSFTTHIFVPSLVSPYASFKMAESHRFQKVLS
uniref:F-box domain-containing protein n=1 Tax=Kingdonia uniflora TaxID=39325 RepID=A0A7J7MQ90_9MAGN|nr:hypothetical protein GIB67_039693 [Kingdonia uniflora]